MKKENKTYLKDTLIIIIIGIIINVLCFLMPLIVHAESPTNYYPVESNQNNFNVLSLEQIFYKCNQLGSYDYSDINYVIRVDDISTSSYPNARAYYVLLWDKALNDNPFYIEVINNNYFEFHKVSNTPSTFAYRVYTFNDWRGDLSDTNNDHVYYSSGLSNLNGYSPLYQQNKDYIFNITINLNQPDNTIAPVLQYIDNPINIGDFTDLPGLDEILNNIQNNWEPPSSVTGHALPSSPTENPNNTPFQERKEFFEYIANTITQNFGNLGYNLAKWFNGIQQKLTDGFNSVSQNIYNGFKTLMDNIKDFFGSKIDFIIDKFNYITEPLSLEELTENLNNGSFSSDLLGVIVSVESFKSSFIAGTEPNSCTFTLDFSNAFYNFGVCSFSLDWLLPIRPIIRLFLGVLCLYSLIVSIFTSLNTYIGGTSSINDDI